MYKFYFNIVCFYFLITKKKSIYNPFTSFKLKIISYCTFNILNFKDIKLTLILLNAPFSFSLLSKWKYLQMSTTFHDFSIGYFAKRFLRGKGEDQFVNCCTFELRGMRVPRKIRLPLSLNFQLLYHLMNIFPPHLC